MGYADVTATGAATQKEPNMILKPAPVAMAQLSFDRATSTFTAEISSTNGLARVYDDACDNGLTVVSPTGREVVFAVVYTHVDNEGDITHWDLRSLDDRFKMVLFND